MPGSISIRNVGTGSLRKTVESLMQLPLEIRRRAEEPALTRAASTWADLTRGFAPVDSGLLAASILGRPGYRRFRPSAFLTLGQPYAHIVRATQDDFLAESFFVARSPMQAAFVREMNRQIPIIVRRLNRRRPTPRAR